MRSDDRDGNENGGREMLIGSEALKIVFSGIMKTGIRNL